MLLILTKIESTSFLVTRMTTLLIEYPRCRDYFRDISKCRSKMEQLKRDEIASRTSLWFNSPATLRYSSYTRVSFRCFREIFDTPVHIDIGTDINCLIPVSDTPSFAITRLPGFGIPIVEGMSVSLKCEVDSNPASTPIWQRGKWRVEKENKKKRERNMTLLLIPQTNADSREN